MQFLNSWCVLNGTYSQSSTSCLNNLRQHTYTNTLVKHLYTHQIKVCIKNHYYYFYILICWYCKCSQFALHLCMRTGLSWVGNGLGGDCWWHQFFHPLYTLGFTWIVAAACCLGTKCTSTLLTPRSACPPISLFSLLVCFHLSFHSYLYLFLTVTVHSLESCAISFQSLSYLAQFSSPFTISAFLIFLPSHLLGLMLIPSHGGPETTWYIWVNIIISRMHRTIHPADPLNQVMSKTTEN